MAQFQSPRGMNDILPEQMTIWQQIEQTCQKISRQFGYEWIVTPIVEDQRIFSRTAGTDSDIVSKEMYVFEDRGGDSLALRPEGTAGVVRAFIEHGMSNRPQPLRLCYFGPFFRYDRPQAGRYRQLWQFGVELIGESSPIADAEVINLQNSLYKNLGLSNVELRINSIGSPESRKKYLDTLKKFLKPQINNLSNESQRHFETNPFRILDSKIENDQKIVSQAPKILEYIDDEDRGHFKSVCNYLDALNINYKIDSGIVRGLDYYTRTVWEFQPADGGSQSTIGAGGRYDNLVEILGGTATPAVGFGTGIERISLNMKKMDEHDQIQNIDAFTIPLGEAGAIRSVQIGNILRNAGFNIVNGIAGRSLRSQLRSANNQNASYALIIGDDEVNANRIQVKALKTEQEQQLLSEEELINFLNTSV